MNRKPSQRSWFLAPVLMATGTLISAQGHVPGLLQAVEGDFSPAQFGSEVASTGDLDGDGLGDWLVGRRGKVVGRNFPELRVLSGQDGSQIHSLRGFGTIGRLFLEALVDIGDVDGDGVTDLAFGNANAPVNFGANVGQVGVFSGASGAVLYVRDGTLFFGGFGSSIASVGDVNGDGAPDLAIGQLGTLDENAYLIDGASGATLFKYRGPRNMGDIEFGYSAAAVGDLDGDLVPDFAMGSFSGNLIDFVSGATGRRLRQVRGGASFGRMLADLGDCDGDGLRDLLVGEPEGNRVSVISGADGSALRTIFDPRGAAFGSSVARAGDVDQDGHPDFIVGDPLYDSARGRAGVFSYRNAGLLFKVEGANPGDLTGSSVAGGLDTNGDEHPDFLIGSPGFDGRAGPDSGQAASYSSQPFRDGHAATTYRQERAK